MFQTNLLCRLRISRNSRCSKLKKKNIRRTPEQLDINLIYLCWSCSMGRSRTEPLNEISRNTWFIGLYYFVNSHAYEAKSVMSVSDLVFKDRFSSPWPWLYDSSPWPYSWPYDLLLLWLLNGFFNTPCVSWMHNYVMQTMNRGRGKSHVISQGRQV